METLCFRSASDLAQQIRAGELSSEAVVQAHLNRIEAVNPTLNAVIAMDAEAALDAARRADEAIIRGDAVGPLHGVPFSVKDWIDAAGLPCAGDRSAARGRHPETDATAVARMRKAGAILLGKTNVGLDNPVFGRVSNPYDPQCSTTGSSSGEAALIAAGASPIGLGSDSGGSIRQPAHACGIAGLKPTRGRIPLTGHFPFISAMNDPRTTIGLLARFVADLALALPLISGEDGRDPSAVGVPLGDWQRVTVRGLRVACYTDHDGAEPTAETRSTTLRVAEALARLGADVTETLPPRIEEALPITQAYWQRPESLSSRTWKPYSDARLSSLEVEEHLFTWDRFRRALTGFMADYEVIITPAAECPAMPHDENPGGIPYTLPYSLTGWPCVVVRAGTSPAGLPIGVQVVARPWRDDVALAVAHAIEDSGGGWQAPPEAVLR